jgi:hypothetical protein
MGKKSREKFQLKLDALKSMNRGEWEKELAATIDSLKEIQKKKKTGAKVLTPGLLHNLRIYKREILKLLEGK